MENTLFTNPTEKKEEGKKEEERSYTFIARDVQFIRSDEKEFVVPERDIPKGSLLQVITTTEVGKQKENGKYVIECSPYKFNQAIEFLQCKNFSVNDQFDYLGLTEEIIYQHFYQQEEHFRNNMYKEGFETHSMNTDPYYDLIEITPQLWRSLPNITSSHENLLFDGRFNNLKKKGWESIIEDLNLYHREGLFMAGGYPFSCLFGTQTNDVDFFLVNMNKEGAKQTIVNFSNNYEVSGRSLCYYVTKNALTVQSDYGMGVSRNINGPRDIKYAKEIERQLLKHKKRATSLTAQVIFRLYRTYSEVLHGFDIDSCCVGYDGKKIWATKRFIFSILFGYNTVNFNRLSPVYERRMVKYAERGLKIYVPGFDRDYSNVEDINLEEGSFRAKGLSFILLAEYIISLRLQPILYVRGWSKRSDYDNCLRVAKQTEKQKQIEEEGEEKARELGVGKLESSFRSQMSRFFFDLGYWFRFSFRCGNENLVIRGMHLNKEQTIEFFERGLVIEGLSKLEMGINTYFEPEFKETNPGEQSTGTFHKIVLKDNSVWYDGAFYDYKRQLGDKNKRAM